MKSMGKISKREIAEKDTYYDFRRKQNVLLFLGSYKLVKKHSVLRALNVLFFTVVQILLMSTLVTSVVTVAYTLRQKAIMGQSLFTFGTVFCAIIYITENHMLHNELEEAAQQLRDGIFTYDDGFGLDYARLKKAKVSQLKFIINVLTMLYMSSVFVYVVFFPLFNLFVLKVDLEDTTVNVYLPLQIYYPFDTRNPMGFSLTFSANGLTLVSMYATFSCYIQVFVSSSLQLTAEYEVLNFSIENINQRALNQLKKNNAIAYAKEETNKLNKSSEFKEIMVHCLNQNIRHHHAILRFKKAMSTFLGVGSAVGVLVVSGLVAAAIVIVLEDPKRYIILVFTSLATVLTYYPGCWIGELLISTSSKTADSLYSTPWPDCNDTFRMNLKIFIQNTIQPCFLRTIGLRMKVSLETFAEVMSAGYKLINLMH